jgi:hypothetical protein
MMVRLGLPVAWMKSCLLWANLLPSVVVFFTRAAGGRESLYGKLAAVPAMNSIDRSIPDLFSLLEQVKTLRFCPRRSHGWDSRTMQSHPLNAAARAPTHQRFRCLLCGRTIYMIIETISVAATPPSAVHACSVFGGVNCFTSRRVLFGRTQFQDHVAGTRLFSLHNRTPPDSMKSSIMPLKMFFFSFKKLCSA